MQMFKKFPTVRVAIIAICTINIFGFANAKSIHLGGSALESIQVQKPALYPEGIDYNPNSDKFIVGSFREGAVYEIGLDGSYRKLVDDDRLNSVLGVRVDVKRDRVFVVNSDLGVSLRSYDKGPKKQASVGVYSLSTGKPIHFIDLGKLSSAKNHLANGITLDNQGNAYITDSFAPVIYKVDKTGKASIFLESERFLGQGINLNGIAFHPDGYLLTVKKGEGVLFKIPLDNPKNFSEVKVPTKFIGGDGLLLANSKELIVVANRASGKITETVFAISSHDNWQSAVVTEEYQFGKVYLTTGAIRKGKIYVMHSNLKALMLASQEERAKMHKKATIQQVGEIN